MRLHALQYLRAIAALAVVYSHTSIQVEGYSAFLKDVGSFGVDIFFVISGFIMIYIAKPDTQPGAFLNARIRRVVPLYWFFTLLMAGILVAMPNVFRSTIFEWDTFILSLTFVPHWSVAHDGYVWPIVAPGWSLIFEMYFYLLFAISLFFAQRYRIAFISVVITIVFIIGTLTHNGESALAQFFSKSMVFEFIFGMLLAVAFRRGMQIPSPTAWFMLILGFALLLLELPFPRIFEYGVPSLMVVTACLYIRIGQYNWAVYLGDASYALYLSHIFTLGVLRKFVPPLLGDGAMAAYQFVAISIVVCIIVSIFIHQYVDNWLLRRERLSFLGTQMPAPRKA